MNNEWLLVLLQLMLERHVNGHFNSDGSPNGSAKKSTENGPPKLFKRNGKRIRFRRQPWSGKVTNYSYAFFVLFCPNSKYI